MFLTTGTLADESAQTNESAQLPVQKISGALPIEAILEFRQLYRKRFGRVLTEAEAIFRANNLIRLYAAVLSSESIQIAYGA